MLLIKLMNHLKKNVPIPSYRRHSIKHKRTSIKDQIILKSNFKEFITRKNQLEIKLNNLYLIKNSKI